jgi:hypothetical protein
MPEVTRSLSPRETTYNAAPTASLTVDEASNALAALINGRPRSPSLAEIRDVVARVAPAAGRAPTIAEAWQASPVRAEWLELRSEMELAEAAVAHFFSADEPGYEEARAASDAVGERIDAFARRIWAAPVRDPVDLIPRGLLVECRADVVEDVAGEPLLGLDAEYLAANNLPDVCDTSAIAHLLDGVRQLAVVPALRAPPASEKGRPG